MASKKQGQRNAFLLGASVLAATAAIAGTAAAQDTGDEEIVVTGTRIVNPNLSAPTAVTTVGQEQIEFSGEQNLADILQGVPSFGAPALSSANSNFLTTGNGTNSLQLRNLGENRTLTLVNGRRWIPGTPGASFVDFNTIPTDLLERVDVVTGGASAIYGADALAGVINVILRDDFEGLEYRYQYGQSQEGDDIDQRFSVLAGGNFGDGRGNAVVNFVYTRNDGVLARDRDNTRVDDTALCAQQPAASRNFADCQTSVSPTYSSFSEYGRFFDYSTGESYTVDGGVAVPWSTATYGFNRQQFRRYTTPIQRYQLSGLFHYDVTPGIEAFAETMFTHAATESDIEPTPFSHSSAGLLGIPCDNPFAPASLVAAACDGGDTVIPFFRRMTELGTRGTRSERNSYRILTGLRGDIAEDLHWETYASYGRIDLTQQNGGVVNVVNFRNALDVEPDGVGGYRCADPFARATGCVPINLFGLGSITPEAAAYVRAPTSRIGYTTQENIGATIGGPAFELPAGPVEFSLGAEWRREAAGDTPDALTQAGLTSSNREGVTEGSYHVGEFFGELEIPLLHDVAFAQDLSIGLAYRYSDYSTLGRTDSYSGRVQWVLNDNVRLRGQYARAVRVPNIGELYSPAGENFATVSDPCNGVTPADAGDPVADRCLADPLIAARITATDPDGAGPNLGSFTLTLAEMQGTGGFTGGGNPNLEAEEADSYNLGVVFNNDFDSFGRVTASVDWWRIEIGNQIATLTRQSVIDGCYGASGADYDPSLCALLVRDTVGIPAGNGALTEVNTTFANFDGTSYFEGIDISLLWSFTPGFIPGDMTARLAWGHALSDNASEQGDEGSIGDAANGVPEDKILAGLVYNVGSVTASWDINYLGDMNASSGFPFSLGSYTTHDLRIGWDVTETANLYFGSNNVFNEDAPIVLSGVTGNTTGTDTNASWYDPIGRTFYAGIRLRY